MHFYIKGVFLFSTIAVVLFQFQSIAIITFLEV